MCDFNNQDRSQTTNWNQIIGWKTPFGNAEHSVINAAAVALEPTSILLSILDLQNHRLWTREEGCLEAGRLLPLEKGVWGARCCLWKFLFKWGSKEAALLVEKHRCSEGTNLLDTDREALQRNMHRDSVKFRVCAPNWALGVTSALGLCRDC